MSSPDLQVEIDESVDRRLMNGRDSTPSDEISAAELFSTLWRRRKTIASVVLATAAVTAAIVLIIPVKYSSEAVILTPQQQQSSFSAMAQMAGTGAISSLAGLSLLSGLGFHNSADLYIGILESRTIADRLIEKFRLKDVYHAKDLYAARKRLARNTTIKSGRDTLIRIRVEDRDPKRSSQLANAYVDELAQQNSTVALTEASQRRVFFEGQLAKEKDLLADAEIALRDTQQATGLVAPTGQADALIRTVSQLHAEILTREAQMEAMKTYVADDNPRFQMVKREVGRLQAELNKLEQGQHVPGTPEVPTGQLPQAGLEFIRRYREVKYHETLYEVLARQYEAARLDEAKSGAFIQVVDRAVVPERKSWPPRTLLVFVTSGFALFAVSFWVVLNSSPKRRRDT